MKTKSRLLRHKRGVVYIEVIMALLPILLTFLGIVQLSLFFIGQLVVQHAATRAARAAIVVLEDDPSHYNDAPHGDLTDGQSEEETSAGIPPAAAGKNPGATYFVDSTNSSSKIPRSKSRSRNKRAKVPTAMGARMAAIRAAAYHPLAVLGPAIKNPFRQNTLDDEMAANGWLRILGGRFVYALGAAAITVHRNGGDEALTQVGPRDEVSIRVSFLLPCGVPVVSALMCSNQLDLALSRTGLGGGKSAEKLMKETEAVEKPELRDLIFLAVPRLKLLQAEASMPNQGAFYYGSGK